MAERSPDANSDKSEFKTKGGVRVKGDLANFKAALEARQPISGGADDPGGVGLNDPGKDGAQEGAPLIERQVNEIKKEFRYVPAGEHWIVGAINNTMIGVERGAKLTVTGEVKKCFIFKEDGAEIDVPTSQRTVIISDETEVEKFISGLRGAPLRQEGAKKDKPPKSGKRGGKTETVREPDPPKVEEPSPLTPDQADTESSNILRRRRKRDSRITGDDVGGVERKPKGQTRKKRGKDDSEGEPVPSPRKKTTKKKASDSQDPGIVPVVEPAAVSAVEPTPPPSVIENLPPSLPSADSSKEEKMTYWEDELRRRGAEYYANIKNQTEGGRKARRVSESNTKLFEPFAEAQDELSRLAGRKSVDLLVNEIAKEAGIAEEMFSSSETSRLPYEEKFKHRLGEILARLKDQADAGGSVLSDLGENQEYKDLEEQAFKEKINGKPIPAQTISGWIEEIARKTGFNIKELKKQAAAKLSPTISPAPDPAVPVLSGEKKVSLRTSHEAGSLEIKLGLALSAAIHAAEVAAKKGEDPSNPLEDPKVKEIEEQIRQRLDSGDENLDAVIRATENELLMSKRFDLGKLKAQAEAVREGKSKASVDKIFQQKQEGARAAMERLTRDADDDSSEAVSVGRGGRQSMHRVTDTVDADSPEAQRIRDKASNKLARKLGLSPRVSKPPVSPAVAPVAPVVPSPVTPDITTDGEEVDPDKLREEQMKQLQEDVIGAFVEYLREGKRSTEEGGEMNDDVIARSNRLQLEAIKAGMNTDELWRVAGEQLKEENKIDRVAVEGGAPRSRSEAEAPAPETSPALEGAEVETPVKLEDPVRLKEILDSARKSFLTMENDPSTDVFNLRSTRERYEKARAEYVGNIVERFVDEQEALALGRAEGESRGGMREFAAHWRNDFAESWGKWLGLKREAIYKKALRNTTVGLAIGVAGIGAGMLGLAAPVGVGALGYFATRRLLGTAATTFGVFEAAQQRSTRKILKISDEELQKFSVSNSEDRLRQLSVLARLQGSWETVLPTYQKVRDRYLVQLQELQSQAGVFEAHIDESYATEKEKLNKLFGAERVRDQKRLLVGLGVSLGVSLALPVGSSFATAKIESWLGGSSAGPVAGGGSKSWLGRFRGLFSPTENAQTGRLQKISSVPEPQPGSPSPAAVARVSGAPAGVMPDVVESPRAGPRQFFPTVFQPGEAPLHEARKAIALYMAETDKPEFKNLTRAQRLWAEERLWDTTKAELKAAGSVPDDHHWQIGKQLTFRRDAIEKVLQDLKGQNADKLADQYKEAIGRVNWPRYFAAGGRGVWEGDGGVKARITGSNLEDIAGHPGGSRMTEVTRQPLNTDPSQASDLLSWNDGGNTVIETTAAPSDGGVLSEDIPKTPPLFSEAARSFMLTKLTGLEKPYYDSVKGLSIGKVLDKRFWGWSEENSWPMPQGIKPNHRDLARYGNFQDSIKAVLGPLGRSEQIEARKLSVDEFVRKYISKK